MTSDRGKWAFNSEIKLVSSDNPVPAFLDGDQDTSTTDDQTLTTVFMNRYQVVPKYPGLPVGFIKATATHRGTGKDNPLKTSGLSKLQLDRSITFIFRNVKQMAIVEEVIRMPESTDPDLDGRNFLFSFDDPARQICDAWTQPPSPPMFPPQSAVAYVIEQEYFLDESWRD